jgi:hypothetical protein
VLFDNIGELDTIFNYLPYLLRLNKFLKNYYDMAQAIVSKFDSYNKAIDTIILEMMEMNRNLTYNMKLLRDRISKLEEQIKDIINNGGGGGGGDGTPHTSLVAGDNIVQLTKDDTTNTYTISVDSTKITTGDHTKITAGTNVTVTHDETTNTYTINSAGDGGTTITQEVKYTNFNL